MSKCWCDDTPDKDLWHEDVNGCQTCYECSPSNVSHCIPHDEACEHYVSDALQIEQHDSDLQGVQRNVSRNGSHLPECRCAKHHHPPEPWCDCPALSACEERVRQEIDREAFALDEGDPYREAYRGGLDAAREAVEAQKFIPLAKTGKFIITRNTKLWDDRQSWAEYGWWQFRRSALAAIDALRATDQPVTSPAKAKSADLYDPQWGEMIH